MLDAFLGCWMQSQGVGWGFGWYDGVGWGVGCFFRVLDAVSGCWMGSWMLF